jgi:hypothetical protein
VVRKIAEPMIAAALCTTGLTFEVSGRQKRAKPAGGGPLD